ncbi:MAG: metallophosphoesterase family protein [Sphingomicrobium sp.]
MFNPFKFFFPKATDPSGSSVPAGTRVYAVGDVHGCIGELNRLLIEIAGDCAGFEAETHLVFLGDLVDRGPASAEVVDRLDRRDLPCSKHHFLMGNHEEVMLNVLDSKVEQLPGWLRYGGIQTLESYGITREEVLRLGLDLPPRMREVIPERHVRFLRSLRDAIQIGDYLFVHAGIRPGVAIREQRTQDMRWIRQGFLDDDTEHGVTVVHGHTISSAPEIRPNRIGIDTGCYESGKLTALALEGSDRRFITTA